MSDTAKKWNDLHPPGTIGWYENKIDKLEAALAAATERAEELRFRLAGAISALKSIKECVPPKDWKVYAQDVLDHAARNEEGMAWAH